jgi:hypothetical protein
VVAKPSGDVVVWASVSDKPGVCYGTDGQIAPFSQLTLLVSRYPDTPHLAHSA